LVNTDERELALYRAERRVREIQTKLHRWATDDPDQQFHDLFNLVCDPAFLLVGWQRVRGNRGARAAGVDGDTAFVIEQRRGVDSFLAEIRDELKARQFRPLPVRERMIPKANGKQRRLGIATVRDRVVQAALKLVLEPIFEADFLLARTGFGPTGGRTTRSPRSAPSPAHRTATSGRWRVTSPRASTRSRIRPYSTGYGNGSPTSASWR
jgi:RNA-directed DNA polymerase